VLTRKLSPERLLRLEIVLSALLDQAKHIEIHFSWRPSSTDPGDDMVVDCAINAGAVLVTWNLADFALPAQLFGLHVLTPVEFVSRLHHSIS
jgi:predicted nucleic acid-binding protein